MKQLVFRMKYIGLFVFLLVATLLFSADAAPTFGGGAFRTFLETIGKATLKGGKGKVGASALAVGAVRNG